MFPFPPRFRATSSKTGLLLACLAACGFSGPANADSLVGERYGSGSNGFLNFYQRVLSPAKGGNTCPMYPSCSQYAKECFAHEPAFTALLMTGERIIACGRDFETYPHVVICGETKAYDPPIFSQASGPPVRVQNKTDKNAVDSLPFERPASLKNCSLEFADSLYSTGLYKTAMEEYLRVAFAHCDSALQRQACSRMWKSAFYALSPAEFSEYVNRLYSLNLRLHFDPLAAQLMSAKKYYCFGQFYAALHALMLIETPPPDFHDDYYFLLSLVYTRLFSWDKAIACADSISDRSNLSYLKTTMLGLEKNATTLRLTNRWIAGSLSGVLPGTGYLYAGRPMTGLVALLINGLFAVAAVESSKDKQYALGALVSITGFTWYLGNIRGSMKAADHRTITVKAALADSLLKDIPVFP